MKIISTLKQGLAQTSHTKRMILFAWFVNVLFALVLALPLLRTLDNYVRGTVMEEKLLQRMDPAWSGTFRYDFEKNELTRFVDYTIFGYAPFVSHLETYLDGTFVKSTGSFFSNLIFRFEVTPGSNSILVFLGLLYVCMANFLAGGFIGIYSKEYRSSFSEFMMEGGKYFGRFFRLALLALVFYYLFFTLLVDWIDAGIPAWTQNSASEQTPYLYYMIKGIVALFLLSVFTMIFDYARIRIVLDDRTSALLASVAGGRFALRNFLNTYGLYFVLALLGVVLIAIYALLESLLPQDSYWPLVAVFLLQQLYMIARFWLKANFYASQTALYRDLAAQEHKAALTAAPSPAS
jgi:hypothetical protein